MKLIILALTVAALAYAQAAARAPAVAAPAPAAASKAGSSDPMVTNSLPIPAARQEAISQLMLELQQAQIGLQSIELASQDAVAKALKVVTAAQAKYDALQDALRVEFHAAKDCQLTVAKVWQCPAPAAGPPPAAPAAAAGPVSSR
jgi:hypothetical protein